MLPLNRGLFRPLWPALLVLLLAGMISVPGAAAQGLTGTIVFQTVSGGPIYAVHADGCPHLHTDPYSAGNHQRG